MVILLLTLIQEGLLSVIKESICTKYWLTALLSLPRKKYGYSAFQISHLIKSRRVKFLSPVMSKK